MNHHQELVSIAKQLLKPVSPIATQTTPVLDRIHGLKCLVFDVYGTLLLSDRSPSRSDRDAILLEILASEGVSISKEQPASLFHDRLQKQLLSARLAGASSPEVDVRRLWKKVLELDDSDESQRLLERVALAYECRTHQVWPVPNAKVILYQLRALRKPLGLISNAQFYTPIILEALLGNSLRELGFMDTLSFFSYQSYESKPAPLMFNKLVGQLERLHIRPNETAIVGNDLNQDIAPAKEHGFRTIHVAIDERSLTRDIDGSSLRAETAPDAVITQLDDLFEVI